MIELVADTEEAARPTAQLLGFVPVAVLPGHIKDYCGVLHDLVILQLRVADAIEVDALNVL
jgi:hypothetical protein